MSPSSRVDKMEEDDSAKSMANRKNSRYLPRALMSGLDGPHMHGSHPSSAVIVLRPEPRAGLRRVRFLVNCSVA